MGGGLGDEKHLYVLCVSVQHHPLHAFGMANPVIVLQYTKQHVVSDLDQLAVVGSKVDYGLQIVIALPVLKLYNLSISNKLKREEDLEFKVFGEELRLAGKLDNNLSC